MIISLHKNSADDTGQKMRIAFLHQAEFLLYRYMQSAKQQTHLQKGLSNVSSEHHTRSHPMDRLFAMSALDADMANSLSISNLASQNYRAYDLAI